MRKPMPRELTIDIEGGLEEVVTPHAGVAGLIQVGRQSNVIGAAEKYLPVKRSAKGLGQGQMVEAFVVLSVLGGECVDDFDRLRRDEGLAALLGYELPAASTARQWLDRFHEGVYPSGKFGANAAWLRLQVLTHNLLELFKAAGLDREYRQARPKRLRFAIFSQVGRVVRHAGRQLLRVAQRVLEELVWRWRRRFRRLVWAPL